MNVAAYQVKKENENMGKREAEQEEKKQSIDCREARVLPFCDCAEWSMAKKGCMRGAPRITETLGMTNGHFDPAQTESTTAPPRGDSF